VWLDEKAGTLFFKLAKPGLMKAFEVSQQMFVLLGFLTEMHQIWAKSLSSITRFYQSSLQLTTVFRFNLQCDCIHSENNVAFVGQVDHPGVRPSAATGCADGGEQGTRRSWPRTAAAAPAPTARGRPERPVSPVVEGSRFLRPQPQRCGLNRHVKDDVAQSCRPFAFSEYTNSSACASTVNTN